MGHDSFGWLIILAVMCFMAIGPCFLLWIIWMIWMQKRQHLLQGFEVNLTDQNSVTAKKENDHG
jgi:hypothetical protein